jgi:RNA polymerase sigma-70 factor (ECF subfamily)
MSDDVRAEPAVADLLDLYDTALPQVYGYLLRRCESAAVAEDLTSETFLAAVDALGQSCPPTLGTGWLIGVARHKLADHWRRQARDGRRLTAAAAARSPAPDPWPETLDRVAAEATLRTLAPAHRHVLALRYLDDLPVAECAALLDRSLHATEALLARARSAFRTAYTEKGPSR